MCGIWENMLDILTLGSFSLLPQFVMFLWQVQNPSVYKLLFTSAQGQNIYGSYFVNGLEKKAEILWHNITNYDHQIHKVWTKSEVVMREALGDFIWNDPYITSFWLWWVSRVRQSVFTLSKHLTLFPKWNINIIVSHVIST